MQTRFLSVLLWPLALAHCGCDCGGGDGPPDASAPPPPDYRCDHNGVGAIGTPGDLDADGYAGVHGRRRPRLLRPVAPPIPSGGPGLPPGRSR